MHRHATPAAALILSLLAGCGGGGGGGTDSAVSSSPSATTPAPIAEAPTTATSSPASETGSPPSVVSPPNATPLASPPPTAEPPATPEVSNPLPIILPPAAGTFITGDQLARAIALPTTPFRGSLAALCPIDNQAVGYFPTLYQTGSGSYILSNSQGFDANSNRVLCPNALLAPNQGFQNLQLEVAVNYAKGSTYIGDRVTATLDQGQTITLTGQPFLPETVSSHQKNTTVHEWRSQNANEPWFVQLQVASDDRAELDPARYKLCWHVNLPSMQRLVCHRFLDSNGEVSLTALDVLDDSFFGKHIYRSF